jgi:hypothetical protein
LNLFVDFIIISMIENVSHFILGMIFGLSVYLFIRISIVSKKLESLMTSLLPSSTGGRHGA